MDLGNKKSKTCTSLRCAFCLVVPETITYQCANHHLLCAECLRFLVAESRLRGETAVCPTCGVGVDLTPTSRSLSSAIDEDEKLAECPYCSKMLSKNLMKNHTAASCERRPVECEYKRLSCTWTGPLCDKFNHELRCPQFQLTGCELYKSLQHTDNLYEFQLADFDSFVNYLSSEKVAFVELEMSEKRSTDGQIYSLYYETAVFTAFNNEWIARSRVFPSMKSGSKRTLNFQLILTTTSSSSLQIHYMIVKGPFGNMKVKPRVYRHEFKATQPEGPFNALPLTSEEECNRLLCEKTITFRLIMFYAP